MSWELLNAPETVLFSIKTRICLSFTSPPPPCHAVSSFDKSALSANLSDLSVCRKWNYFEFIGEKLILSSLLRRQNIIDSLRSTAMLEWSGRKKAWEWVREHKFSGSTLNLTAHASRRKFSRGTLFWNIKHSTHNVLLELAHDGQKVNKCFAQLRASSWSSTAS
jgi:hypothetical protein